jgi:hypothetical protein
MRTTKSILIGLVLTMLGASVLAQDRLPGVVRTSQYREGGLNSVTQPDPIQPPSDTVYSVGPYPLYTPELAPGEGRNLVNIYCQVCHSTTYITMQPPLPAATWEAEVNKMIKTHGAPIPEEVAKQITTYLQANYTPETRKQ